EREFSPEYAPQRPPQEHGGGDGQRHDPVAGQRGVAVHRGAPFRSAVSDEAKRTCRSAGSTGLVRWWSKPASVARRLSSSWPQPVIATNTISRPHGCSRMWRATSYPVSFGIPMSSKA